MFNNAVIFYLTALIFSFLPQNYFTIILITNLKMKNPPANYHSYLLIKYSNHYCNHLKNKTIK